MKCLMCGGTMEQRTIEVHEAVQDDGNYLHYIVTGVPANVCRQCGETTYSPGVLGRLQAVTKAVRSGKKPPNTINVPVYTLGD